MTIKLTATVLSALALGGVVWAESASAEGVLECQIIKTERFRDSSEKTTNMTWVLKINKDTWELISAGGFVVKDVLKPGDEMFGPQPLTTTDTSYTLVPSAQVNRVDAALSLSLSGIPPTINRITGEFYSQVTTTDSRDNHLMVTDTEKGQCQQSSMKPKL